MRRDQPRTRYGRTVADAARFLKGSADITLAVRIARDEAKYLPITKTSLLRTLRPLRPHRLLAARIRSGAAAARPRHLERHQSRRASERAAC